MDKKKASGFRIAKRRGRTVMGETVAVAMACSCLASADAATWYVDSAATGARNGTSWANAWRNIDQITGVSPGDTVYISGGPAGSTKTYNSSSGWTPVSGSASARITYTIGREPQHNGTAVFNAPNSSFIDKNRGGIDQVVIDGSAGDGKQHFKLDNVAQGVIDCPSGYFTNSRFAYVDCGDKLTGGFYLTETTHIEIDHVYLKEADGGQGAAESVIYATSGDNGFDTNKIHDNHFFAPCSDNNNDGAGGGSGNDVLRLDGNGWSVYNNILEGYPWHGYFPRQHQDGVQMLYGDYFKIYNNEFRDIAGAAVYADALWGGFNHLWIFNNVITIASINAQSKESTKGIEVGEEVSVDYSDVIVANNLVCDYGDHRSISIWGSLPYVRYTGSAVFNNIVINCQPPVIESNLVSDGTNVTLDASGASAHFVRYSPLQGNNDFHLLSTDTMFNDKGVTMSEFNFDKDGTPRPQGSAWDIGPYEAQ